MPRLNIQNFAWLGITDEENEGTWLDTNGNPLTWTNFNNQEDGKDHAKIKVASEPPGKWKYSSGNDELATLCLRGITPNIPDGYLSTSWGASQTMEYKFYFNKNYNEGVTQCAADGPYKMPVITSQDENDQFSAFLATQTQNNIWLGINDEQNEDTWIDQDGHAITFTYFRFNNNDNTKNHARLMQDINGNWNGQWKYQEGDVPGILLCMRIV